MMTERTYTLHHGDSREILKTLAESSVDSIVCDPPYHLTTGKKGGSGEASVNLESPYGRSRIGTGFMGMTWDGGDVAHDVSLWAEALRVAKPGAWLLAFGGTRTYHRLACAIEDAGWELRDSPLRGHMHQPEDCPWLMAWGFGSGFPKSHNGPWGGTALKPAWEPIVCARKPLIGTVEANWREHGTGALNIDGCRIDIRDDAYARNCSGDRGHDGTRDADEAGSTSIRAGGGTAASGRWPANLIHDGSDEVVACFPREAGQQAPISGAESSKPAKNVYGEYGRTAFAGHNDSGSAARFFYAAKTSREDRNEGCEHFARKPLNWSSGTQNPGSFQAEGTDRTSPNHHPTVKPTDLMRYLCRLVTPKGGIVLDPFMGSGSTGKAAMLEGFNFIGVDLSAEYIDIARARIDFARRQGHQTELI
jgi:DNA modification methylase